MNTSTCPNGSQSISWDLLKGVARSQSTMKLPICAHALQNSLASLSLSQLTKAFTYLVNSELISPKHLALSLQHAKVDSSSHTTQSTNLASLPTSSLRDRIAWLEGGMKGGIFSGMTMLEYRRLKDEMERREQVSEDWDSAVKRLIGHQHRTLAEEKIRVKKMQTCCAGSLYKTGPHQVTCQQHSTKVEYPFWYMNPQESQTPVGKILFDNEWITWEEYEKIRSVPSSSH